MSSAIISTMLGREVTGASAASEPPSANNARGARNKIRMREFPSSAGSPAESLRHRFLQRRAANRDECPSRRDNAPPALDGWRTPPREVSHFHVGHPMRS